MRAAAFSLCVAMAAVVVAIDMSLLRPQRIATRADWPGFDATQPPIAEGSVACERLLTDTVCRHRDLRQSAFPCDAEADLLNPTNGVSRTYKWMGCGETGTPACLSGLITIDGADTGHMRAPYMCLEMRPADHLYRVQCVCWARTGGTPVTIRSEEALNPEQVCNPVGEYLRFDKDEVTPATQKCCSGLHFGCLDRYGGTTCDVRTDIVYQFCYNHTLPLWKVSSPYPGATDNAINYTMQFPDRFVFQQMNPHPEVPSP